MKRLIAAIIITLIANLSFANNSVDFNYLNYKDFRFQVTAPGSYALNTECTFNDLAWDKEKKSYKMSIEKYAEKGTDIVEVNGNTIKRNSYSSTNENIKKFSESVTTFTAENSYVKKGKIKIIYPDKVVDREVETHGTFANGNVTVTRYVVNGEVQSIVPATALEVRLDKEGKEIYEADSFESPTLTQEMEDSAYSIVFIKSESVCVTKTEKL